jgi:hypothetical protein
MAKGLSGMGAAFAVKLPRAALGSRQTRLLRWHPLTMRFVRRLRKVSNRNGAVTSVKTYGKFDE